ncbi:MAG: hypothetical protein ACSHXK_13175 [Oceanococcus sp.]
MHDFTRCLTLALCLAAGSVLASGGEKPRDIDYTVAPPAPAKQTLADARAKSAGCVSCHTNTDELTMHQQPGIVLGCTDCHGGRADVELPSGVSPDDPGYMLTLEQAHVLPRYPDTWDWPSSKNPEHSYALLNQESTEYVRFVNPGDLRAADEACGACHQQTVDAAKRSLMATAAMFWEGASYNNGILPYKRPILGEAYTRDGEAAKLLGPVKATPEMQAKGVVDVLWPMPAWETTPPGDVFRIFERGGRVINNLFPETANPNVTGNIQELDEPGRPDQRQSNRGPGTGLRISVPVLNIHKTRLNDPLMWFLGTNDQPGDYRSSGCSSCHVVYANDRDPKHSGPYAAFGHKGETQTLDPTISKNESGHPISHSFTSAIPTSSCMTCHMHQPNIFVNSYLGYTMWDYESDAPAMWPKEQKYPDSETIRKINQRNPEAAAVRGKWGDPEFLEDVSTLNEELEHTQFADYHGHGWNFRSVFKKDRKGNLLDGEGDVVSRDDPNKFKKAVHMASIHADAGMHCVDCHFSQDAHGNGHMMSEVAEAVEIECSDCHGTAKAYPALVTTGPAAPPGGNDLSVMRTPDGRPRFEWVGRKLFQRSNVDPNLEWELSLVKDSVTPGHPQYNKKAARAKTMSKGSGKQNWGSRVKSEDFAHGEEDMTCYSCHLSWTTSCGGCHLPVEANWLTEKQHYEGGKTRNFATYNPQVVRDQMFQLGKHGPAKGGRVAPVRSSSALVLSSRNVNRELIYIQQPPISSSGFSSQAFAPHFPHTVRKTETKNCSDCHLSADNDNNAIMAQLLLQGTGFVNFIGYNAWIGGAGSIDAVQVTEWEEPQAVIGSYLHKYAYPDWYAEHQMKGRELSTAHSHGTADDVGCLQMRGEYLFVAQGEGGFEAYDISSIANKGFSQRIISAPFSALGHDTRVSTSDASCVALPTNQPINPLKNTGELMREVNQEQAFHPIYNYAVISDRKEGLILVDVNTLADGEPRNNFLERAVTWDANGQLKGARHVTLSGHIAYVSTDDGLAVVDLDQPLMPKLVSLLPIQGLNATAVQFRYLFAATDSGMQVVDITNRSNPKQVFGAFASLATASRIYLARTYAYVAAGSDGLAIIDIENPLKPKVLNKFTAEGQLTDVRDVVVGSTNASLFAYVADGAGGLKVVQLTSPDSQPNFYGFSPEPRPELVASYPTKRPALSLSRGLDRDRAVDEDGHQIAVFGRIGSRPFTAEEMADMYLNDKGEPWFVKDSK